MSYKIIKAGNFFNIVDTVTGFTEINEPRDMVKWSKNNTGNYVFISNIQLTSDTTKMYILGSVAKEFVFADIVDSASVAFASVAIFETFLNDNLGFITEVDPSIYATITALNLKANIASPTFTGIPTAPTAALATNTTQLATTAFVLANAGGSGGICGISNASGVYTYYATLTLAIAAAVSGEVVEVFCDIVETGAVEITLKNGVNINGNGHTYTLNNVGLIHAFKTAASVVTTCNILNYNAVRAGGAGAAYDNNTVLFIGIVSSGTINLGGSTFRNTGSGAGVLISTNSTTHVLNGTGYSLSIWGGFGCFSSAGAKMTNCTGIGASGGYGIRAHSGGELVGCHGYSDSGHGISGLQGTFLNCVGVSVSGVGFQTSNTAINCVGRSTSSIGFDCSNQTTCNGCIGISVSGVGMNVGNGTAENPSGISSSNFGTSISTNVTVYNSFSKAETSASVRASNPSYFNGGVVVCNWNNAAGYGIIGNGGAIAVLIVNCIFKLSNAAAPYLFNGGFAQAISMANNTYRGGAAFNVNLTQAIVNTHDSQGNIYL